jgi:hypothetical protein
MLRFEWLAVHGVAPKGRRILRLPAGITKLQISDNLFTTRLDARNLTTEADESEAIRRQNPGNNG